MTRATPFISTVKAEALTFLRSPSTVFVGLFFPAALLLAQGHLIPGLRTPMTQGDWRGSGLRMIDLFVPVMLVVSIGSVALSTLPSTLGSAREHGLLRRLALTPLKRQTVLGAPLGVGLIALCCAILLALTLARLTLQIQLPAQPLAATLMFVAGTVQLLALGGLIAARARSTQSANALGMLVYFASLYTAGLWTPLSLMPGWMKDLFRFMPMGAVATGLTDAWYRKDFPLTEVLVCLGWSGVFLFLAVRLFRWE